MFINLALRCHMLFFAIFLLIGLADASPKKTDIKPSFDCHKAKTEAERLVCANWNLALSDLILNDLYLEAIKQTGNEKIREQQKRWISEERDKKCLKRKKYLTADLSSCYRQRIRALAERIEVPQGLNEKYTKLLLSKKIVEPPSATENPAKRFIQENNLSNTVTHMLGECSATGMWLRFWDGKHLIVKNHSSSVECTGRSVHNFWDSSYCLLDGKFITTEKGFFSCPAPYATQEVISLGKTYLETHVTELLGNQKTKERFLGRFLEVVKETKNPYLSGNWLYTNETMTFVSKNLDKLSILAKSYEESIIGVLEDLMKVHDAIMSSPNWKDKFKNYRPHLSHHYADTHYNPVSEGFDVITGIEQKRITAHVHYTYHELYHRFWYKCYQQQSIKLAYKAIAGLHGVMLKSRNKKLP